MKCIIENKINKISNNNSVVPNCLNSNLPITTAKVDSGTTKHCFSFNSKKSLLNFKQEIGPPIILPNSSKISSTATAHLPLKNFSPAATKTYLLNDLKNSNLISLGQLCDNACYIVLTKKKLNVCKNKSILLQGFRNLDDGLWDISLP